MKKYADSQVPSKCLAEQRGHMGLPEQMENPEDIFCFLCYANFPPLSNSRKRSSFVF